MTLINVDFLSLCAVSIITYTFIKFLYMTPDITKMPSNNEPLNPITNGLSYNLIIARYNESLEWLNRSNYINQFNTIKCYNKGDKLSLDILKYATNNPDQFDILTLPNIGREVHTYLTYIIDNYDNLGDINVFVTGSCDGEYKWYKTLNTFKLCFNNKNSVFLCEIVDDDFSKIAPFSINEYTSSDINNRNANNNKQLEESSLRPYGNWYKQIFNDLPLEYYCLRGIFAVSKQHIHNQPIEFYKNLLNYVNTTPNPETGHYIERSWIAIFNPIPKECLYPIPAYIIKDYFKL